MLEHDEPADLLLEQLAAAAHQRAVGLQRLDQPQDAADVVDRCLAQPLELVGGEHAARASVREELDQQRPVYLARDDVRALDSRAYRLHRARERGARLAREMAAVGEQLLRLPRGELRPQRAVALEDRGVGEEDELGRAQGAPR